MQETFAPAARHGGHDTADSSRGLRYVEWVRGETAASTTYVVDFAYLLREGDRVRVEQDRHVCGLFPRETWPRLLERTGFDVHVVEPEYADPTGQLIFACRRPA